MLYLLVAVASFIFGVLFGRKNKNTANKIAGVANEVKDKATGFGNKF